MKSQSELAYSQIKQMIMHMELMPGDHVPELLIASKFNISRTPIHDALRRLEADGLVQLSHNRGASVTVFSEDEISDLGAVRLSQDILSAKLASYYGSASDFERLLAMANACSEAAAKGDVYGRIQMDMDFHLEISRIGRNTRLISQQEELYQQIHLVQISKYTGIENSLVQIHHHVPIVEAIRSHDLDKAGSLICEHIQDFYHLDPYLVRCYGIGK